MDGVRPRDGGRVRGRVRPQLEAPGEAQLSGVVKQGVAGTEVGKVWIGHREALVTDIEVESRLDGVGESRGELPSKVPLVRAVSSDFGQGGA